MNIQLIHGQFNPQEAIDIITKMIHVKIKFQESKISGACSEDDMKMRENKIKRLQNDLHETRLFIEQHDTVNLESTIVVS